MKFFRKTEVETVKKCPHCQTDISAKAKKCPNCQSDLRQWHDRHPILTLLGLIIIIPIIISWIIPNGSSSPKTSNTNQNQNTEQKEEQPLLELQSLSCYREYSYFIIEGMVKNISDKPLESVLAVGNTYTENGEFVKSSDALIEYNPILSGQASPFKVMTTDNPAIKKCKVDFKEFWGGTILTKDGRAK